MNNTLSKKLQTRHINMIAIGGSIGTGIFLASGYSIHIAGPGGALFAYALMAVIVYFLMTSLGEMSAHLPSSGAFCEYSKLYVGKDFGFAMGYSYWLNWAITLAVELSAAALIMGYWFPHVNGLLFSLAFFVLIVLFNVLSVRIYGEVEYALCFVKVAVIMVFIVLGVFALFKQPHFGVHYWQIGDAPFHGGYLGFITVFLFAGFSFQGTEMIGIAAGDAKDPKTAVPKATKVIFWRLTLFFVLSIGIIGLLIPYNDPRLAFQDNVAMSPYTLIFSQYVSHYAGDVINFIILVAVISAGNASMYTSTRTLWYLGRTGEAPKVFAKNSRLGVPVLAMLATALIGCLFFLSSVVKNGVLFSYLVQISSLSGFIAWFGIALSHYMFRKKHLSQLGGLPVLDYKAKFYPYAQIISMIVIVLIVIAQFVPLLSSTTPHVLDWIITYSSVILFFVFYFGHKYYRRAKDKQAIVIAEQTKLML